MKLLDHHLACQDARTLFQYMVRWRDIVDWKVGDSIVHSEGARTVCITEPPWPDGGPHPWGDVGPVLSGVCRTVAVWGGHLTDPRWLVGPIPDSLRSRGLLWLQHLHDDISRAHEVVYVFGEPPLMPGRPVLDATMLTPFPARPVGRWPVYGRNISLARQVVRAVSRPGDLVVDPFCGSGSILRAALLEGRRALGVDIDIDRVEVARGSILQLRARFGEHRAP